MNQAWIKYLPASLQKKVEGRDYLQNVINNTGWQFADNILRMGVGLVIGVWVARYLGPEQYGLLSYALAFGALFLPLTSVGLEEIVVRNIVRDPLSKDETLGTAFVLKLIGGSVAFVVPTALVLVLRPTDDLSQWLVWIIVLGNLFQAFNVIESWFNSQIQAKYIAFARSAAFITCSGIKIALILTGASLITFAVVATLEVGLGSLGLVIAYRSQSCSLLNWRATVKRARSLLHDSWPLLFSMVAITIYQRIDQIMLMEMVGSEEVGIYSVAVRLTEVWIFIPTVLFWSVFPSILEAKKISDELFYDRLQKFYNLMALISYAIAVPMTILSPWLVDTLFGEVYAGAVIMLATLVWANLFWNLEMARCAFLTSMNWNRFYFLTVFLACLLNIALNYFLIPRYGGMGAVVASIFAYWFAAHGSCFMSKKMYKTGFMLSKAIIYPKPW